MRRLMKDKAFSGINVLGLVIGISSFLILFIYVANEKSFDKHFAGHRNIYRVTSVPNGQHDIWARSLGVIHTASATIPEIEMATQFTHCDVGDIKIGDMMLQQKNIMSVDEDFIKMFEVKSVMGDLSDIAKPNTVFISENFAKKHFDGVNPIGQTIGINELQYVRELGEYEICGIVKNTQDKTHFKYELLLSQNGNLQERFESLPERKIQWTYNYFKLQNNASPEQVADKVKAFWDSSVVKQTRGPKEYDFSLTPVKDIHLKSDCRFELQESVSKINIGLFVVISFVILMLSLLNFINLTIAKLIKRSKELGLKRSIGANNIQLMRQILSEVFIFCLIAIVLSFLAIEGVKPLINGFFDIEFRIYYGEPVVYLSILLVLTICLGLTAIFVSVFLLGRNSTIDILAERNNYSGSYVLKSLLVVQVAIVIVLMSGTFLVNKQIDFVLNKPMGFDKDNVVVIHLKDLMEESPDPAVFAQELEKQSQVVSVGMTVHHFGYPAQGFSLEGFGIDGTAEFVFANYNYLKTMNIKLVKNWIIPSADTVRGMVVNNHLYKRLMEKHGSMEALNAYQQTQPLEPDQTRVNYIGVAEDFDFTSAHEAIGDFAFWLDESKNRARFVHVRLNNGSIHAGMEALKNTWQIHYPNQEFSYFFIDEKIAQQYKAETILSRILFAFSGIGILISMIGISALSLFISQQRTKEIGIRKVNGARISEILAMLNRDFIKWVTIAYVIACPIAWYAMNKWLENFAYKTGLSWWIFALAGILALGFALLTVSWQSWRAATRNPVESLRYE